MAGENRTNVDIMPEFSIHTPGAPQVTPGCGYGSLVIQALLRPATGLPRRRGLALGLLLFLCCLVRPGYGLAASEDTPAWETVIAEHPATPTHLIAVDKSRQHMALFEHSSPLRLSRTFPCTTGQAVGDKMVEGDLKTPEGIYFVVQHITTGLDFIKYGNEAYTLNYPNPIDRLRGKTGYGIWIHGRGEPLTPLQTEGCVSMNNSDLAAIGKLLTPGAPVALTGTFSYLPAQTNPDSAAAALLENRVRAWAKAWSDRSDIFFDFYDKNAYAIAQGEPFSAFQAQKERLFKRLPWINTTVHDVRVLQGPGYWVTWFYQDYKAPNLTTRGIRRLYWSPDGKGEFKILGMEWHPGMSASTLVASADAALPPLESDSPAPAWPPSEAGSVAWYTPRPANAAVPPSPAPTGQTAEKAAADSGANAKEREEKAEPAVPVLTASAAPAPQAGPEPPPRRPTADHVEDPQLGPMARPSAKAEELASRMRAERARREGSGPGQAVRSLPAGGDSSVDNAAHPALSLPPALASQKLSPASQTTAAPQKPALPQAPLPTDIAGSPPAGGQAASAPERPPQSQAAAAGASPVPQTPVAPPAPSGPQAPATTPPAAAEAEITVAQAELDATLLLTRSLGTVEIQVEQWRQAWESGRLDAYIGFYAPRARQGGRNSAAAIRRHKEKLWAKAQPASVALQDLQVAVKGKRIVAAMRQEYADSKGNGDIGRKVLIFEQFNDAWLITQEDWEPLTQ